MNKALYTLTLAIIPLTLVCLAVLFDNERVIFLDNALHVFLSINEKQPGVMAGRWPIVIVRIFLWLAIELKIELNNLITIYSLSHILFKIGILGLIFRLFGLRYLTIAAVCYLLPLSHTYFWCVSELAPALLFIIPVKYYLDDSTIKDYMKITFLVVLAMFTHPQSLIGIVFIITYNFNTNRIKPTAFIGVLLIGFMICKSMFFPNWYDTMKMEGLLDNISKYKYKIYQSDSFEQLITWSTGSLLWIPITLIICLLLLLINKRWYQSLIYSTTVIGSMTLFVFSNPEGVNIFYAEASMYLISFISAFVIIDFIKTKRQQLIAISIVGVIAIIRITLISGVYTERLNYVASLCNEIDGSKTVLPNDRVDLNLLKLDWGLPYETLIYSELNQHKTKTIVTEDYRRTYSKYIDQEDVIFNGFGNVFKINNANDYFNISFKTPYKRVKDK